MSAAKKKVRAQARAAQASKTSRSSGVATRPSGKSRSATGAAASKPAARATAKGAARGARPTQAVSDTRSSRAATVKPGRAAQSAQSGRHRAQQRDDARATTGRGGAERPAYESRSRSTRSSQPAAPRGRKSASGVSRDDERASARRSPDPKREQDSQSRRRPTQSRDARSAQVAQRRTADRVPPSGAKSRPRDDARMRSPRQSEVVGASGARDYPRSSRAKAQGNARDTARARTSKPSRTPLLTSAKSQPISDEHIKPSVYAPDDFVNTTASAVTSFVDAGVHPDLVRELTAQGIVKPFPIQAATLPIAISGRDVLGRGQTGSGKTLAFGLAILTQLALSKPKAGRPMALVLSPTRELAMQSAEVLMQFGKAVRVRTQLIAGGMSYSRQMAALEQGVHIVVATPGRLLDLVNRGVVELAGVRITVLDEADQMADMGFLPDVRTILDQVKSRGQRMLFSATLDRGVDTIIDDYMYEPSVHAVDGGHASVSAMSHHLLVLHPGDKDTIIAQIAARRGKTIMFARSQLGAERIGEQLMAAGIPTGVLHGGKSQRVRNRTLQMFKDASLDVLVATDVAARGIHVDDVSLVLQVDLPNNAKDYLHRAGRTARAGESGVVVALTTTRQRPRALTMLARADVPIDAVYVKPLSDELVAITGARTPSGRPWSPPAEREPAVRRGRPTGRGVSSRKGKAARPRR